MRLSLFSHLSIRHRLPLVVCLLLLSFILVFGVVSYVGIRKASINVGKERLVTVTDQLTSMLAANTRNFISSAHVEANSQPIISYILSNGKDSLEEATKILRGSGRDSSTLQALILNSKGEPVLSAYLPTILPATPIQVIRQCSISPRDFGKVGRLYRSNGQIYYPIICAVVEKKQLIGYILRWRKMNTSNRSVEQIARLLGGDANLYIGNADGSVWTDEGIRHHYGTELYIGNVFEFSKGKKPVFALISKIPNSEWVVSVELSKGKMLEAANSYLYWMILIGSSLLVIGVLITRYVCRSITHPLRKLTMASSEIASGNYSVEVLSNRFDELGKLARSFNAMAFQVSQSKERLEQKAENYKILFENNPMPMWIIDRQTLSLMDVNNAAVQHYGYSRDEFLQLSSIDLRPEEDVKKYIDYLANPNPDKKSGVWRHRKKDGSIIMVDIMFDDIVYRNKAARVVLANDITEKLRVEAELLRHQINQQKVITETTILAQEKEREELGRELHDNINQILTSTKLYLELANNSNENLREGAIKKSYENLNLAILEIRQLSKQLVPPSLDDSLLETLKGFIEEINAISRAEFVLFDENFNEFDLNDNLKLVLYRIIQEQVNNILKHANARHVRIQLESDRQNIFLTIVDDGNGFNTKEKFQGIGMRNIHNRVKFHKGKVQIKSQPGKGCSLRVVIPANEKERVLAAL